MNMERGALSESADPVGAGISWTIEDPPAPTTKHSNASRQSLNPGNSFLMTKTLHNAAIWRALNINTASTAWERTVDITTTGAKTGHQRRIEIWFHHISGHWYLSSLPARPNWYYNLLANPHFTFHLKHGVSADLAATARPVTDFDHRRQVFQHIIDDLNQPHNPALIHQPQRVQDWIQGSPLMEIIIDGLVS